MSLVKPKTIPGVMELLPRDQIAFQGMLDKIRCGYELFGFLPIATPAMEHRDVLLTKTGGETEREVYFALSTGSLNSTIEKAQAGKKPDKPKMALRFDLTVPLARYVAEHERQIIFPFRRYQMQQVYRGERAQRGRYREFYQCDVDIVGKDDLPLAFDTEIPTVIYHVFKEIDIGKFTIHINNRKLLCGFFSDLGITSEKRARVLREIDKLDKHGPEAVAATLTGEDLELEHSVVKRILEFVALCGDDDDRTIAQLEELEIDNDLFRQGLSELREVVRGVVASGVPPEYVRINLAIARGLDYYTGTIYETLLDEHPGIGSVCSGGRYDNLAEHYTDSKLPGVGISIGATRLFYKMKEARLIDQAQSTTTVLVTKMPNDLDHECLNLATELRQAGINTEVVCTEDKLKKQMRYADRSGIRFAIILGEEEIKAGTVAIKDLLWGNQMTVDREDAAITIEKCLLIQPPSVTKNRSD